MYAGLGIYDVMQYVKPPVYTYCTGIAASMGAFLLAAGEKENRYALPNARIMIHQPLGGVRGSTKDIEISTQQIVRLKQELNEILARETGQPVEKVAQDTNRDYWFTADEAKAYGMISKTVTGLSKI